MGSFRREKVAGVVQEIVTSAIARKINDPRVSPLTTVTRVKVTGDMLIVTVYLTVPGDEKAEKKSVAGMKHAAAFVQRMLAAELGMRLCPELRFEADEELKRTQHTLALINENRRTRPDLFPEDEILQPKVDGEAEVGEEVGEDDEIGEEAASDIEHRSEE